MRVVFRVAAGPLTGYGHLRRAVSLAAALRVRPVISLRGGKAAAAVARELGCIVISGSARAVIAARRPSLVVVDDSLRSAGLVWVRAARQGKVFVAGVADAGIGCVDGDVVIDGSAAARRYPPLARQRAKRDGGSRHRGPGLCGPRYAILDPRLRRARRRPRRRDTVVIALGGGSRQRLAAVIARELSRYGITVRIAPGFTRQLSHPPSRPAAATARQDPRIEEIEASALMHELATCAVAIVGGGVTLYEACALGTPSVAVPVVAAQRPAIDSCAARGAVVDGGAARPSSLALGLLASRSDRTQLARAAARLVDGGGAARVARELRRRAQ